MAEYNTLYSLARYYDIVFKRAVGREIDFVTDLYRLQAGRPPAAVLDLACGPGYHARECARRGLRAVGVDVRGEMITFADAEARAEQLRPEWVTADLRDFTLPQPVDVALCLCYALDCLLSEADLLRHLRAVAANLTAGGLYVIEQGHPRELYQTHYGNFFYEGERDGCHVGIDWATNRPEAPDADNVWSVEITLRVRENGSERRFVDHARERFWLPEEIAALANRSGALSVCAWYGDFSLHQPMDDSPGACRMVAVLQKPA